jgi:ribosome-binding protein aMBF1 (putative translation factor)
MKQCHFCNVTETESFLYKAIHKNAGRINICNQCYRKEKPVIVTEAVPDFSTEERRETVRERLSRMSGVEAKSEPVKKHEYSKQDMELKDLIEKNIKEKGMAVTGSKEELIDKFHWAIMRKRRLEKLTRKELAEKIQEQEIVIESLEKGELPRNYQEVIRKIENFLSLRLFKEQQKISSENIIAESKVPKGILLSELQEESKKKPFFFRKKKDDIELSEMDLKKVEELVGKPEEKPLNELSDEEIEKMIWGS